MDSLNRGLVLMLIILGLVAFGAPFMMGPGRMGPDVMEEGNWHWGMMWGLGGLTMLVFWGLLIVGVVLLIRLLDRRRTSPPAPTRESPIDIARRRYAAGELSRDEFEQMRRDLEGH